MYKYTGTQAHRRGRCEIREEVQSRRKGHDNNNNNGNGIITLFCH